MAFTDEEITSILSDFPKFELSYETMTHKKVYDYNIILAIPDGKKCFAWFTSYKDDNVCFIMELDSCNTNKNTITNIYIGLTGFNDKLAYGTILYGTIFSTNNVSCFYIEDLYFYKGINYSGKTFMNRLHTLKTILKSEISQQALTNKYTVFGLPLMDTDLLTLLKNIEQLPYKPKYLKYRWYETKKIMCAEYYNKFSNKPTRSNYVATENVIKPATTTATTATKNTIATTTATSTATATNKIINKPNQQTKMPNVVFHITADSRSDIYNLFIFTNGKLEFYDYAFIPDYETSVKMNKLFRNIKENNNLDTLEESDDEDDFQDDRSDKYVYLDRFYKMYCQFNYKFKKWMPLSVANEKEQVVSYNQLQGRKF